MAFSSEAVVSIGALLNDEGRTMAERFRALFTLRGIGTAAAVREIERSVCTLSDFASTTFLEVP